MDYADTNFVVAVFFHNPARTPAVERRLRRQVDPVVVGELAEFECRNVFTRLEKRPNGEAWRGLAGRLERGEWRRQPLSWPEVSERAARLLDQFAARLSVGSLDVLHVAAALESGCQCFLSFDSASRARVLAASVRLAVWPDLTPAERGGVIR
ncbi:MAG: PIN domain-containing protein [Verrucomicrobia bacterium]|nr:PIN domain-containing protein [Verrucomicrobiota bacterium]